MFGDINVRSRPLRLALIIQPTMDSLHKAVQINSTLWGGVFNPIIPLYRQAPAAWRQYPQQKISLRDRTLGYIRAFDPDILVNATGQDLPPYLSALKLKTISIDEIWAPFYERQHSEPRYGVGIFELLNGIYEEYFAVKRRFPMTVTFPALPKDHQVFWAAAIGHIPGQMQDAVEKHYAEAIDIEKPEVDAQNYAALTKANQLPPRRISRYRLETRSRGRFYDHVYGFYMDASAFADVVDFWNLRAIGRTVLPIPKQFAEVPEFLEFVRQFVKDHYRISQHNPDIDYGTTIVRSFSSKMSELEALAAALQKEPLVPDKPRARILALQHWYPRIWDEWAMGKDGATPDDVYAKTEEFSFPDTDGSVTFNAVRPEFVSDRAADSPRYANEIYPKFYGGKANLLADILPYDHGINVLRATGGATGLPGDTRIGRSGLVHLMTWDARSHWQVPLAEDVFFAWLKDKGLSPELSTCGRLAKQVLSQLDGWHFALTNEPLLQLLEKMNRGGEQGRGLPLGEVKNTLKAVDARGNFYRSLVERGVFQLGYKTQCTHCQRSSWHSISSLASRLVCPLCHKELDAISAVDRENQGDWHLKTAGPFSVSNFGDGSYSVVLTLNFFERDHTMQTTPVFSFTAKEPSSGTVLEADFGMLWQEAVFGEMQDGMLFAECKSYNLFKADDFRRMRTLAKRFPGAVLAFCTLRKTLTASEVKALRALTKSGLRRWKAERPINPVLILTGTELLSHSRPPYCWERMTVPEWAKRPHSLLQLCNSTQAIYLGTPPWQETWHKEFERRRAKRQRKPA